MVRPFMPFGCPGGDAQVQGMLEVFLNIVEFGMEPQEAIEAPRVISRSFPNSFWPHGFTARRSNGPKLVLRLKSEIPS